MLARMLLRTSNLFYSNQGGVAPGGGITILATGSIVIQSGGSITANGTAGGTTNLGGTPYPLGAGAGGIILLASRTSISNAGSLTAKGGNGTGPNVYGPGGGGGGGIVIYCSRCKPRSHRRLRWRCWDWTA